MSCFWGMPFTPVEGACGFALVLALSQMREHGLGPFGRADLHPRRNPLDRQGRFAPQPGSDGQLAGVVAPASGQLGLLPAPARKLLRDDAVGSLLGGLPVEFPGVALAKLTKLPRSDSDRERMCESYSIPSRF